MDYIVRRLKGFLLPVILFCMHLLFIVSFAGCDSGFDSPTVTFIVRLHGNAVNEKVCLTGNTNNLGRWNPAQVNMDAVNDSTRKAVLSFPEGKQVLFKVTAGSWVREALNADGGIFNNFSFVASGDTTVYVDVYGWSEKQGARSLTPENFKEENSVLLNDNWRYASGDSAVFASPGYDDSGWKVVNSYIDMDTLRWRNVGWFRIHLAVDSALFNKAFALYVEQRGASEIYLNGKIIYTSGTIGTQDSGYFAKQTRGWKKFTFGNAPVQTLAMRYANYEWEKHRQLGKAPAFVIYLRNIDSAFKQTAESLKSFLYPQLIFTTIPFILFIVHLFLFAFYPKQRQNLFYALCLLGFAAITYLNYQRGLSEDPGRIVLYTRLNAVSAMMAMFFGTLTSHSMLFQRLPRRWIVYLLLAAAISLLGWFDPGGIVRHFIYGYVGLIIVDTVITGLTLKEKQKRSAKIISIGFYALLFFVGLQILTDYAIIEPPFTITQIFVYGMVCLALSMLLFLSYNIAEINTDLEKQLANVKLLSEKAIEQERLSNKLELDKRLVEAENARKTQELESARALQLSLLPEKPARFRFADIACHMQTAAEVGGDYYDFFEVTEDSITIAIGDATGHGLKAGNMVMAIKCLISALAASGAPDRVLSTANNAVKNMQLKNLMMCLALVKIERGRMVCSSAGMPPVLMYRAATQEVQPLLLKAMPLGAARDFPYARVETELQSGDVLLLASDGLYELFNPMRELFGQARVEDSLRRRGEKDANGILAGILDDARQWQAGALLADDLTAIVVKIK